MCIWTIAARFCVCAFLIGAVMERRAWAQSAPDGVLTPAPVPNVRPAEVAPADRVERPNGAERAAPFSGLPSSVGGSRGESPANLGEATRQGSPVPSLSK